MPTSGRVAGVSGAESQDSMFRWLVQLRWVALLGVALVLLLAGPVLHGLPAGSGPWLGGVALLLFAYNALLTLLGGGPRWRWLTHPSAQIVVDCVALAALVHHAGGIENPFLPLFVLHVVNANIALRRRAAGLVLALTTALVSGLVLSEGSGLVAHHCLYSSRERCFGAALELRPLAGLGGLVLTFVAASLVTRSLTAKLWAGQRKLLSAVHELREEKERLKDATTALEVERTRLQAIVDCMSDAVTFLGPDGHVLLSNQRAREVWHPDGFESGPEIYAALAGEIERDPPTSAQSIFERAGRTYEATHSLVHTRRGVALGMVMVARDITDRVAMEKHLVHEEQMSVVGKLAAAVAHEINNPIGVVCLYSQHALAKSAPDSPIRGHLETIRRNADDCRRIIGDLLKLSRPRKPERRRVDLRQLCRDIIESIQPLAARVGGRAQEVGHRGDVPIWAEADAGLLGQAVLNLALNAVEASGEGGVVSISAYETQDGAFTARVIEVRDNGPGIAEDVCALVFQPFFTTKPSGTGLGLAVAENIVRSHLGRIDVDGAVGTGAVFRIVLPERAGPRPGPKRRVRQESPSALATNTAESSP